MRTADGETFNTAAKPKDSLTISEGSLKWIAIIAGLMLAAYLAGYVPGWLASSRHEEEIARLKQIDNAHTLKADLAAAAMHASQGRFDEAIPAAGAFFDRVRKQIDVADGILHKDPAIRQAAVDMLARRDEVVTMLARGDPNAAGVLTGWYFELERITNGGE